MANENLKRKNPEDVPAFMIKQPRALESGNLTELSTTDILLADLPKEVLEKITDLLSFKDLFILERVNKRMREISLNIAWPKRQTLNKESINYGVRAEDLTIYNNRVSDRMVESILSRPNIKYLDVSKLNYRITYHICFLLHLAPKLIKLDLSYFNLNNDRLKIVASSCPLLEHASFKNCSYLEEDLDEGLEYFFERCLNLKYLDLTRMEFSGECFAYIPTKLRYLNLYYCESVTSNGMELLSKRAKDLETLIMHRFEPTEDVNIWLKKLTNLRFLQISRLEKRNSPYLDLSSLQKLEMLCLRENILVNVETVKFLKSCPKLKGFDLSNNGQLKGSILNELKSCKALKYCDLSWFENLKNVVDLVETMKLEYLAINYCCSFSRQILKSLMTECNSLSQLKFYDVYKNHDEMLAGILSEKCIQRPNILKLSVKKRELKLLSQNWCEVMFSESESLCISNAIQKNETFL